MGGQMDPAVDVERAPRRQRLVDDEVEALPDMGVYQRLRLRPQAFGQRAQLLAGGSQQGGQPGQPAAPRDQRVQLRPVDGVQS